MHCVSFCIIFCLNYKNLAFFKKMKLLFQKGRLTKKEKGTAIEYSRNKVQALKKAA